MLETRPSVQTKRKPLEADSGDIDTPEGDNADGIPTLVQPLQRARVNLDTLRTLGTVWAQKNASEDALICQTIHFIGAGRGGRTPTRLPSADFESAASASSAIPACLGSILNEIFLGGRINRSAFPHRCAVSRFIRWSRLESKSVVFYRVNRKSRE